MRRSTHAPPLWLLLAALTLTALTLTAQAPAAQTPGGWITVQTAQHARVMSGFASVQPGTAITITALQPSVLISLSVAPGDSVQAGQTVARLGGSQIAASLATAHGASDAANAALAAEQGKFAAHLSTRADVAQANANAQAAKATLAALRSATRLQSPVAGQVQSVTAGPGAALQPGQAVAMVQPASGGWVKVVFYGAQATTLPSGMAAMFAPANGAPAEAVTLRGVLNSQVDGGLVVAFFGPALPLGQAGTLSLALPPQPVILVPSEALVLDNGQWWVMLHDTKGDRAVKVVPGEAEGAQTPILAGLAAGEQVIVADAALLYHRGIAAQFQPPD